jgi:hypothetical protein
MIEETTTNTAEDKNEVFAAYDELLRKLKDTQKSPAQVVKEEQIIEEKQQVIAVAIKETRGTDLALHLNNLKASLNQSLDEVQIKLLAEQDKFITIQQAVEIQQKELMELYEIRPAADTLHALLMAHKEKSSLLDQEILHRKRQWKKEQEEFETHFRNEQERMYSEQKREEEEYLYKRDMLRQKEQDQYDTYKRNQEHELSVKRLQVEEELRIREAQIAAREHEFELLKNRIAHFPEEIQRAIAETEKTLGEKLQLKFEYEAKLMQKDFDTERKALEQAIATHAAEIEHLKSRNYAFTAQSFVPQNSPDKLY